MLNHPQVTCLIAMMRPPNALLVLLWDGCSEPGSFWELLDSPGSFSPFLGPCLRAAINPQKKRGKSVCSMMRSYWNCHSSQSCRLWSQSARCHFSVKIGRTKIRGHFSIEDLRMCQHIALQSATRTVRTRLAYPAAGIVFLNIACSGTGTFKGQHLYSLYI